MNLFSTITHIGVSQSPEYQERRGVLLSNYISLILSAAILLLYIIKTLIYGGIAYGLNGSLFGLGLLFFCFPIILNGLKLTTLSRVALTVLPVVFLWYVFISQLKYIETVDASIYDSMRIFLLTFSFIPYLIFNKNRPSLLILGVLPTLLSVLLFEVIFELTGQSYFQRSQPGDDYQLMQMRTIVAYIILSGASYTFHSIISINDAFNQKIQKKLKEKSDEVTNKNKELKDLNLHLEELVERKTDNIRRQNKVLVNYAHSNSHLLRAPVARLIGLLQLSKMEKEVDYNSFFSKIENEAYNIDEVVRDISKEINELGDVE